MTEDKFKEMERAKEAIKDAFTAACERELGTEVTADTLFVQSIAIGEIIATAALLAAYQDHTEKRTEDRYSKRMVETIREAAHEMLDNLGLDLRLCD